MSKKKFNIKRKEGLFSDVERVKPMIMINVGSLLDIPTGSFVVGKKGETIINGGLGPITGLTAVGNNYKSTIMHYMMLSAGNKVKQSELPLYMYTYDTEINMNTERCDQLAKNFPLIMENPTKGMDAEWVVTNKEKVSGNTWAKDLEDRLEVKSKDKDQEFEVDFTKDPHTGKDLKLHVPSFIEIDSFTEFEGEASFNVLSNDLDGSDTKTYAMNQGMLKTKFMARLPYLSNKSNNYFLLTAHLGDKIDMNANPYSPGPTKKLQYLKGDQHMKGTGSKFYFLTTQVWLLSGARQLVNQATKGPEFPTDSNDGFKNELNIVDLTLLRNKNGPSGGIISIIVSQSRGVLPTLSEFYYIKNSKKGISGNDRTYHMDLYPDVNLSRTTVRKLIDSDPKLRRAINITAELLQLIEFHYSYLSNNKLLCTPLELYEDIKKLGYDWNELLNTRGYWLYDQYENEVPFLSTIDLLKMRVGQYHPYFMKPLKNGEDNAKSN